MTRLRKMILEELQHRTHSQSTTRTPIRTVDDFARYFRRRPDQLGPEHTREYQAQLFSKRKLAPNTVAQRLAALSFFFVKTLHKPWSADETPYPKYLHVADLAVRTTTSALELLDPLEMIQAVLPKR